MAGIYYIRKGAVPISDFGITQKVISRPGSPEGWNINNKIFKHQNGIKV
jgi:hypothetical protein